MIELNLATLAGLLREAATLARAHGEPAYVLAPGAGVRSLAVLWPEITAAQQARVAAVVLPDGSICPRWGIAAA